MRVVASEAAELAVGRVMTTLAMGRTGEGVWFQRVGRLGGTTGVVLADPRHSMVLPHITAIAEEFSRRLLILCSLPHLDLRDRIHQDLWQRATSRAEGTWNAHREAWLAWHDLRLVDAPDYERLDGFVEARNAVMHGLGQLTRLQTQRDGGRATAAKLRAVGIILNGKKLVILPTVLDTCAATARGFIEWLDAEIRNRALLPQ